LPCVKQGPLLRARSSNMRGILVEIAQHNAHIVTKRSRARADLSEETRSGVEQDKRQVAEVRHMQGHTRGTKVGQAGDDTRAIAS
jgi:hypothetical protein